MIEPTIGRVVLYRPKDTMDQPDLRHAAQIAFVHGVSMVNIGVLDEFGVHYNEQMVRLMQDDEPCQPGCCEWMPYQKGQAVKLEAKDLDNEALQARIKELEEKLKDGKEDTSDEVLNWQRDEALNEEEPAIRKKPASSPGKKSQLA